MSPVAAFVVIPALLVAAFAWGVWVAWLRSGATTSAARRASISAGIGATAWMLVTWTVAANGLLRQWDRTPPPFGILMVAVGVVALGLPFSRFGARLARFVPLWALVAVQAFRLPLELAMHAMAERGVMPPQMSYSGRNFDIVTGVTAVVVAVVVRGGWGGGRLVAAWNVLGLTLLVNVVVIAVLSTPTFRYFGDERLNTWVTEAPFVWLPAVMVLAALAGHLLIFRALALHDRERA